MNNLSPENFEKILDRIKHKVGKEIQCDEISSIESNFNTKGMNFRGKGDSELEGTIIVGEDNGAVAVDISLPDGKVRSFVLKDRNDIQGINNITGWLEDNK